jgi:hypothetical protein
MCHAGGVWLIIRAASSSNPVSTPANDSIVLLVLPQEAPVSATVPAPVASRKRQKAVADVAGASPSEPPASPSVDASPEPPQVDWDNEIELAAKSAMAATGRENAYRNLAALSPEQLAWVRHNQLEPAAPGIAWKYRRVEITEGGFPIIHINEHCVAIPLMMMMVFCKIGHIEANGKLFEHMRDR